MQHITLHWENVWDRQIFFSLGCLYRRAGFTSPARHRGDGGATRENDSMFSTLRARRAGHGARARARLATGGSPVDSPSGKPSGAEIGLARPARKRPTGRKKTRFYFVARLLRRMGCFPRGDASWYATGECFQSPSSLSLIHISEPTRPY